MSFSNPAKKNNNEKLVHFYHANTLLFYVFDFDLLQMSKRMVLWRLVAR